MSILKVHIYGSPILSKIVDPILKITDDLHKIVDDMFETMYSEDGIGLSANQVGLDMSLCIVDFNLAEDKLGKKVFINMEILEKEGECLGEEGCLSVPDIREKVNRAKKIKIKYQDINFNEIEEEYIGFPARVLQHEYDHLHGIFFVDRLSPLKKSFLKSKLKRLQELSINEQ